LPHLTLEYSANLENAADIGGLCAAALEALLETGLFEAGAIRVRAVRCEFYAIADGHAANSFVDASLRAGAGRSFEQKKRAGEAVFAALARFLAPQFDTPHFALSFEIRDIDPELSWKKNAIHPRLRGA
jgi:5-carboxymethyl-2-hydroxymuconate isomerase